MRNSCYGHGYLVGMNRPLPTDPSDYDVGWNIGTVGCNNLFCRQCKLPVRNAPGLDLCPSLERAARLKQHYGVLLGPDQSESIACAKILYDLTDPSASPLVQASARDRLYFCRCSFWTEAATSSLDPSDPTPADPQVPWSCGGHPVLTLPHEFDGVRAESEADLVELCQRSLRGMTPKGALSSDEKGADWATRLHGRLAGTPWQAAVAAAAAELLDDPDPLTSGRAIQLISRLQALVGMKRGLELLQSKRAQFVGIPDQISDYPESRTLEDSLLAMILPLARQPGPALDFVRAEVMTPGKGRRSLYRFLAACDPQWLAANAEAILRATPAMGSQLLDSFRSCPETFDARAVREQLKAWLPKADSTRR